jgi:hypothetical protein
MIMTFHPREKHPAHILRQPGSFHYWLFSEKKGGAPWNVAAGDAHRLLNSASPLPASQRRSLSEQVVLRPWVSIAGLDNFNAEIVCRFWGRMSERCRMHG